MKLSADRKDTIKRMVSNVLQDWLDPVRVYSYYYFVNIFSYVYIFLCLPTNIRPAIEITDTFLTCI